jgi:hypothetical protein
LTLNIQQVLNLNIYQDNKTLLVAFVAKHLELDCRPHKSHLQRNTQFTKLKQEKK